MTRLGLASMRRRVRWAEGISPVMSQNTGDDNNSRRILQISLSRRAVAGKKSCGLTVDITCATMKQIHCRMYLVFICQLLDLFPLAVQAQDTRPDESEYAFGRPTYHNGPYKIWSRSHPTPRLARRQKTPAKNKRHIANQEPHVLQIATKPRDPDWSTSCTRSAKSSKGW